MVNRTTISWLRNYSEDYYLLVAKIPLQPFVFLFFVLLHVFFLSFSCSMVYALHLLIVRICFSYNLLGSFRLLVWIRKIPLGYALLLTKWNLLCLYAWAMYFDYRVLYRNSAPLIPLMYSQNFRLVSVLGKSLSVLVSFFPLLVFFFFFFSLTSSIFTIHWPLHSVSIYLSFFLPV